MLIHGDACAANVDRFACALDTGCGFTTIGARCPDDGSYCQSGVCAKTAAGLGVLGTCACPDGGVCFEQVAGSEQAAVVTCATPAPGGGDPCLRVADEGVCKPSAYVTGLCVCDHRL